MNLVNWQTAEGQRETMCRRDFTDLTNFWVAVRVTRQLQRAGSIWTSCKVFCPRANLCHRMHAKARTRQLQRVGSIWTSCKVFCHRMHTKAQKREKSTKIMVILTDMIQFTSHGCRCTRFGAPVHSSRTKSRTKNAMFKIGRAHV